jgi:hypothetical protein
LLECIFFILKELERQEINFWTCFDCFNRIFSLCRFTWFRNPLCSLHFMLIRNDVLQSIACWVHCTYIHTPQTKFMPLKSNVCSWTVSKHAVTY